MDFQVTCYLTSVKLCGILRVVPTVDGTDGNDDEAMVKALRLPNVL